ncbi:nucleotidyltransferase domain-containing protein [Thioalkalivibrio sp. ALE11]|uniref:nucleotidyltransferase domain-containing protein n=1 Tax=Thioalkalivibrio sp. ALE11 TaxID=1265494 RepID=UPI00037281C7|nr:nucleotidyltransferase domain-containing protein [Thioalkalivibrio sp. ALE11]
MRLSPEQQHAIHRAVGETFGPETTVWLFGSRTDDSARGGDIDLLIDTPMRDVDSIVQAEIALRARLEAELGEQKIDLLVDYPGRRWHPSIFQVAREEGIPL